LTSHLQESAMSRPTAALIAELTQRLREREAEFAAQARAHRAALGEPGAAGANTFIAGDEGAVNDSDDARELALTTHSEAEWNAVRAALARIELGEYGSCARCGREIGEARLRAAPEAALCLACQRDAEQRAG
jgi:DnaK suppressor protein